MDQKNRTESPEISPRMYSQWIFNKMAKKLNREKNILFNKWLGNNLIYTYKGINLDPLPQTTHKNELIFMGHRYKYYVLIFYLKTCIALLQNS